MRKKENMQGEGDEAGRACGSHDHPEGPSEWELPAPPLPAVSRHCCLARGWFLFFLPVPVPSSTLCFKYSIDLGYAVQTLCPEWVIVGMHI